MAESVLILVSAARHPKAQAYFRYFALLVVGWAIFLTAVLTLSQYTPSLRQQFVFIIFIFIFGYIMTGVKPLHMLIVGCLPAPLFLRRFFICIFHLIRSFRYGYFWGVT